MWESRKTQWFGWVLVALSVLAVLWVARLHHWLWCE